MPEDIQIEVQSSTDALLTLAIPNYPGWTAEVNGDTVPIVDIYGGLMGIPLNGDDEIQRVRLRFQLQSVLWGGVVSLLASALMLLYLLIEPLLHKVLG
jgi:uncharacterized membrane protein YfhO